MVATGAGGNILSGHRLLFAPKVRAEILCVYSDRQRTQRDVVDDAYLKGQGIHFADQALTQAEIVTAARFAIAVDDGEAQALALAKHRGVALLSDDIAALRVAHAEGIEVVESLDLVLTWGSHLPISDVATALQEMRDRAHFALPRGHRLTSWYSDTIAALSTPVQASSSGEQP